MIDLSGNASLELLKTVLLGIGRSVLEVFGYVWWIVIPLALAFYWWDLRVAEAKKAHGKSIKWTMLELRIPKENLRTPKSMEQVFAALHTTYSGKIGWWDKNIKGKSEGSMSFEMVGQDGGVYFYIRIPEDQRNLIESALFSQYPQIEISPVDDYTELMPASLPNMTYNLWGTDMILSKEDAYPIRTYPYFEEKEEEQRIDPMAGVFETMSKLKGDELLWMQFIIRPTGDDTNEYKKKGQAIVDKMLGREVKEVKEISILEHLFAWFKNFALAIFREPQWPEAGKKSEGTPKTIASLNFTEKEILEGVEGKISKLCYEVNTRFLYIDRKETFNKAHIGSINGAFKQLGAVHLNSLKSNGDMATNGPKGFPHGEIKYWFSAAKRAREEFKKKQGLYDAYKGRSIKKASVFSVEELATLYHVPGSFVGAPRMRRIEAKKGEPPENLPIA